MNYNNNLNISLDQVKKLLSNYTSEVKLMHPNLPILFERLRYNGIKMTLNTGYPAELQEKIIDHFHMKDYPNRRMNCCRIESHGWMSPLELIHTLR